MALLYIARLHFSTLDARNKCCIVSTGGAEALFSLAPFGGFALLRGFAPFGFLAPFWGVFRPAGQQELDGERARRAWRDGSPGRAGQATGPGRAGLGGQQAGWGRVRRGGPANWPGGACPRGWVGPDTGGWRNVHIVDTYRKVLCRVGVKNTG
jgi:hypothetical protein